MILDSFRDDAYFIRAIKSEHEGVFILCDSVRYTIVPAYYHSSSLKNEYFSLSHVMKNDESILESPCLHNDYFILFSLRNVIKEEFEHKFSPTRFIHCSAALVSFLSSDIEGNKTSVLVYKSKNHFHILICNKGVLVLVNSFVFSGMSDIVYHTLNGLRKNKISVHKVFFRFSGSPEEYRELIPLVDKLTPAWHYIPFTDIIQQIEPVTSSALN